MSDGERFTFEFDDKPVPARAGDTVASALYRSGRRIFTRSFKFHRPRGLLCLAGKCPNCLVNVDGAPNVRSCVPAGYPRRDDGGVQQVVATAGFAVVAAATLDLAGTTDHPGLLVELQQVGAR